MPITTDVWAPEHAGRQPACGAHARDIEAFTPISGARNTIPRLATRVCLGTGTVVLDGSAVCSTLPRPS